MRPTFKVTGYAAVTEGLRKANVRIRQKVRDIVKIVAFDMQKDAKMLVPVAIIRMQNSMRDVNGMKDFRSDVPSETIWTGPLNKERLESIRNATDPVPPVKLIKSFSGYSIIDGRHRVVSAILSGNDYIDALVCDS